MDKTRSQPKKVRGRPFEKGKSGNPSGRPKGAKNKRTLLREELEQHGSELAQAIKRKALEEGDSACMAMWLARLEPPLRSAGKRVYFDLDPDASPSQMSSQILVAVSNGQLDPDTAKTMLDMVSAHINLRDVEALLAEF